MKQEYFQGVFGENVTVKVKSYFMGGAYELDQSGVVPLKGHRGRQRMGAF